jgi:hypothetical protein
MITFAQTKSMSKADNVSEIVLSQQLNIIYIAQSILVFDLLLLIALLECSTLLYVIHLSHSTACIPTTFTNFVNDVI